MKISKKRIERLMAEQGLTLKALAERCGFTSQNLSTLKNRGSCNPASATRICTGLGCEIKDILPPEESEERT